MSRENKDLYQLIEEAHKKDYNFEGKSEEHKILGLESQEELKNDKRKRE